ncbi:hypothetical protein FB563_8071 [Streptomyces puniciscabiei]|uniref:Tetratricopeptide repeat protein n=1 Tax=Streptomyces puniciscabiei TaxID=164348 RepID=A0A542SXN9_9ACTN|nr:hypothetical protein [Streptomyces puniciscabiei]TQK79363.1 hypothetical protein FB563_8071 [Streptomyces puniciscabiei]
MEAGRAASARIEAAEREFPDGDRDTGLLRLRHTYARLLHIAGAPRLGPAGKGSGALAALRDRARDLYDGAPDEVRRGWAAMYRGLIADHHFADAAAGAGYWAQALRAGEGGADDLLAREALRHRGGHDHGSGAYERGRERWRRATALGARAGAVPGTLSQLLLLAVLARDTGDEAGATALATDLGELDEARALRRLPAVHGSQTAPAGPLGGVRRRRTAACGATALLDGADPLPPGPAAPDAAGSGAATSDAAG